MSIKLTKNGGVKILSEESGLIKRLRAEGWTELKEENGGKSAKTSKAKD